MGKDGIILLAETRADIFSADFCKQLNLKNMKLPPIDQTFYYDLGIFVNLINVCNINKIQQFHFDHGHRRNLRNLREEFNSILSEQFIPVYESFESLGYRFGNAFISTGSSGDADSVTIIFFRGKEKEYDENGKLKKNIIIISTIPHGYGFNNFLGELLAEKNTASKVAESQEQIVSKPVPSQEEITSLVPGEPQIILQELFKAISAGVAAKGNIHASISNRLAEGYKILDDKSLNIEGPCVKAERLRPESTKVTYPQWLLYIEKNDHTWCITVLPSGTDLQCRLQDTWRQKSTCIAIPFYNLKPIDYTIAAKQLNGYTKIPLTEVHQHSELQIMWDNPVK